MHVSPENPTNIKASAWSANGTSVSYPHVGDITVSATPTPSTAGSGSGEIVIDITPAEGCQVTHDGNTTKIVFL